MDTRIEKRVGVQATSDRIWELISGLPSWDRWNPHETDVSGTIAFGGVLNMTEHLPGTADRRVQARIGEWQPRAQLVWAEKRGFLFNTVRYFEIEELEKGSCIVASGLIFSGLRGEMFHDKHRNALRRVHEAIAEGLRRAAEA